MSILQFLNGAALMIIDVHYYVNEIMHVNKEIFQI